VLCCVVTWFGSFLEGSQDVGRRIVERIAHDDQTNLKRERKKEKEGGEEGLKEKYTKKNQRGRRTLESVLCQSANPSIRRNGSLTALKSKRR
jgi:hypothetical protein